MSDTRDYFERHCEHCIAPVHRESQSLAWILGWIPEQYREDAAQALHDVGVQISALPDELQDDVRGFSSRHYGEDEVREFPAEMPQKIVRAMTSSDQFGGRVYTHPVTGEEFRSVTTILGAAAKPALDRWKVKTISEFAADNRENLATMDRDAAYDLVRSSQYTSSGVAAATGEAVHGRLETLFEVLRDEGEIAAKRWMVLNPPAPELQHVDTCFLELLDEFEIRPLYMENTLVNRSVGYAGSADLIAMIRPRVAPVRGEIPSEEIVSGRPFKRAVIDAKSGKSIYGSVSLQLVAYAKAEAILLPDGTEIPMPAIHETYALHVRPRSWSLRPMRYDVGVWDAFRALVVVDQWVNRDERRAVGDAINQGAISRRRSYNKGYGEAAA